MSHKKNKIIFNSNGDYCYYFNCNKIDNPIPGLIFSKEFLQYLSGLHKVRFEDFSKESYYLAKGYIKEYEVKRRKAFWKEDPPFKEVSFEPKRFLRKWFLSHLLLALRLDLEIPIFNLKRYQFFPKVYWDMKAYCKRNKIDLDN